MFSDHATIGLSDRKQDDQLRIQDDATPHGSPRTRVFIDGNSLSLSGIQTIL
jgi:hypothetical protein